MNEDEKYAQEEADAEVFGELKRDLAIQFELVGVLALPWELEKDIYVEGALTDIIKVYLDWRSEIDEELG